MQDSFIKALIKKLKTLYSNVEYSTVEVSHKTSTHLIMNLRLKGKQELYFPC